MSQTDCNLNRNPEPPSQPNGLCARCQTPNAPGVERCTSCQSFLLGNGQAIRHAGYARELFRQPEVGETMAAERSAVARDLGDDLGVIKSNLVESYIEAVTIRRSMFETMRRVGPKGRAYDRYVSILDREMRLASLLGLERRTKAIPNLRDFIHGG